MRSQRVYRILIIAFLSMLIQGRICDGAELTLNNAPVQVYFSPNGGCSQAIVREIDAAKSQILVQAYSFTSRAIAKALMMAHKRGVTVEVILDRSQTLEKYNPAKFLTNSKVPTFVDKNEGIAHSKIMIIDGYTIITGSFNFTNAAEYKNVENLLIIKSKNLAKLYIENWQNRRQNSEPYSILH